MEPLKEGFYCKEQKDEPFRFILMPLNPLLPAQSSCRIFLRSLSKIQFFSPQSFACFFFLPEIEMRASRACLSDELACTVVYMYHCNACRGVEESLRQSLNLQRGKTMNGQILTNDRREKES